jgi:hypothetical protein
MTHDMSLGFQVGTGEDGFSKKWTGSSGTRTWEDDHLAADAFANHIAIPHIDYATVHLYASQSHDFLANSLSS